MSIIFFDFFFCFVFFFECPRAVHFLLLFTLCHNCLAVACCLPLRLPMLSSPQGLWRIQDKFFKIPPNASSLRKKTVPWNHLDCHCYCISWHVNTFVRKCFVVQVAYFVEKVFLLKWASACKGSLCKNWKNIFHVLKRPHFHIISNVSYFEKQILEKVMP